MDIYLYQNNYKIIYYLIIYTGFNENINNNYNRFEECLNSTIMFLCLPTQFDDNMNMYDKTSIGFILVVPSGSVVPSPRLHLLE